MCGPFITPIYYRGILIFLWQFFEVMYNGDEKLYIMKNE